MKTAYRSIMQWAAKRHFPRLCIGMEDDPPQRELVLPHGKEAYRILRSSPYMRVLTAMRIIRWNALTGDCSPVKQEVTRRIAQVDSLLARAETAQAQQPAEAEEGVCQ